ncbi:hypothetical protein ACTFIZ_010810 [Dictyostelium cf. discoideum]
MNNLIKGISNVTLRCVSQTTTAAASSSSTSLFYIPSITTCLTRKCYGNKSTTILNSRINNNNFNIRQQSTTASTNIFQQALKETKQEQGEEQVKVENNKIVRVSLQKLGYSEWKLMALFKALGGLSIREAIAQLSFTEHSPSKKLRGLIKHAAHIAENIKGMDPERLIISQIWAGRSFYKRSIMWKGRGQGSTIRKPFCHVSVEVKESEFKNGEKKVGKFGKTNKTFSKYDGNFDHTKKY